MNVLHIGKNSLTSIQRRLFSDFSMSNLPNTLTHHSRIAYKSLTEAGLSPQLSKQLVIQSQSGLIKRGVFAPSKIPWIK